jgi:hypothetical protein
MKQFIVLAAVLPLLLLFVAQFSLEQQNNHRLNGVREIVMSANKTAFAIGGYDGRLIEQVKRDVARATGTREEEIEFEGRAWVGASANGHEILTVSYKVKTPIKGIMAGARFLGIPEEENQIIFEFSGAYNGFNVNTHSKRSLEAE